MQDACAPRKPSLPMRRGRTQETAAEVKLCFSALEEREELRHNGVTGSVM